MIYQQSNIDNVFYGSDMIASGFVGTHLIFPTSTPPVPPPPTQGDYLNFTARNGSATIGMSGTATPNVSYSFDKINWVTWDYSNITLNEDQTVWMKGNNPNGFNTSMNFDYRKRFSMTGTIEANGSVQSLLYEDNYKNNYIIPNNSCFNALFYNCRGLITAPELPATSITPYCYTDMFSNCRSLTTAPQLPAMTLAVSCYYRMFDTCKSLTQIPQLQATTLAQGCYANMFTDCTSITTAILPATTLVDNCYSQMFRRCTSLTTAILPATTLKESCYYIMFGGCTSLNYIKAMFTTTPSDTYTNSWVDGVAANGTFVKNSAATWNVRGEDGVPTRWTIEYADS